MVQLSFQEELFHLGITCLRFTTVVDGWGGGVWGGKGYLIGDLLYFSLKSPCFHYVFGSPFTPYSFFGRCL
jgi:hypothetical protein